MVSISPEVLRDYCCLATIATTLLNGTKRSRHILFLAVAYSIFLVVPYNIIRCLQAASLLFSLHNFGILDQISQVWSWAEIAKTFKILFLAAKYKTSPTLSNCQEETTYSEGILKVLVLK